MTTVGGEDPMGRPGGIGRAWGFLVCVNAFLRDPCVSFVLHPATQSILCVLTLLIMRVDPYVVGLLFPTRT